MTSLPLAALIIDCRSCRGATYGIAPPTLRCYNGTLHFDARMCEAAPVHSQPMVRVASPPSTREDLARSPVAATITKSP